MLVKMGHDGPYIKKFNWPEIGDLLKNKTVQSQPHYLVVGIKYYIYTLFFINNGELSQASSLDIWDKYEKVA